MTDRTSKNRTHHEFRDGPIKAGCNGECVIIEANDAETGDDAEVCLDIAEARAFHTWLGRVLGVHETEAPLLLEICALRGELELTVEHLEAANRACEEGSKTIDAYRRKYGTLTDEVEETKPCEHLRSELLAEKQADGELLFQMRKCLDCKLIFRVRSSLKSETDPVRYTIDKQP